MTIDTGDTNPKKSDFDKEWKSGGSFYKECIFWDVFRQATGQGEKIDPTVDLDLFAHQFPMWRPTGFDLSRTDPKDAYQVPKSTAV